MTMETRIERFEVRVFKIPTGKPESDGTYIWDATTMVVVNLFAGGISGFGYTYADIAAANLVQEKLAELVIGRNAFDISGCRSAMLAAVRNIGESGIASLGISATDNALWDLKAKLLNLPLIDLLGASRESIPAYGSGGFTSYSVDELQRQLAGWAEQGLKMVKMKIGREPKNDPARVGRAREAIGNGVELFVDANGAYSRKQAMAIANDILSHNVCWFEEPVSHHDREGLRMLCHKAPSEMEISAGEYGFTLDYLHQLLREGCVDVLQADATRCGISGFMATAVLCEAYHIPLSSHCAPSLHIAPCCAAVPVRHLEYFHDHVEIERMLFDGFIEPVNGVLTPNRNRPGLGVELREEQAGKYEL